MDELYIEAMSPENIMTADEEEQPPVEVHSNMAGIIRDYDVLKNVPTIDGVPVHGDITNSGDYTDDVPTKGSRKLMTSGAIKQLIEDGAFFGEIDETLTLKDGVLSVNTTNEVAEDNTLPITSAAVAVTVGNIEVLLETI